MKDLVLIFIMLAIFAFGFFLMVKADRFIGKNQRRVALWPHKKGGEVRIAAENAQLLHRVEPALKRCAAEDLGISISRGRGKAAKLLQKLHEEQLDIVLLTDRPTGQAGRQYGEMYLSGEEGRIHVLWKKKVKSKNRDRVIFALENETRKLTQGYADYLE